MGLFDDINQFYLESELSESLLTNFFTDFLNLESEALRFLYAEVEMHIW